MATQRDKKIERLEQEIQNLVQSVGRLNAIVADNGLVAHTRTEPGRHVIPLTDGVSNGTGRLPRASV